MYSNPIDELRNIMGHNDPHVAMKHKIDRVASIMDRNTERFRNRIDELTSIVCELKSRIEALEELHGHD